VAIEVDRQAGAAAADQTAVRERLARLTPREREVGELLIAGKTSKEIAAALHVSVRTVEGHRRMVFSKATVSSAAQLVRVVVSAREASRRT
jgi:two-component system, LuxR family, response regulator FixJ